MKHFHAAGSAGVRFLNAALVAFLLLLFLLSSTMSQSSQFSNPSDLAAHFRYKTDYNAVFACRSSLAAAADAASADQWVRVFGDAVVRLAKFLFLFGLFYLFSRLDFANLRWLGASTARRRLCRWSVTRTTR